MEHVNISYKTVEFSTRFDDAGLGSRFRSNPKTFEQEKWYRGGWLAIVPVLLNNKISNTILQNKAD